MLTSLICMLVISWCEAQPPLDWAVSLHRRMDGPAPPAVLQLPVGAAPVLRIGLAFRGRPTARGYNVRQLSRGHTCDTGRAAKELRSLGQAPYVTIDAPGREAQQLFGGSATAVDGSSKDCAHWYIELHEAVTSAPAVLRVRVAGPRGHAAVISVATIVVYLSVVPDGLPWGATLAPADVVHAWLRSSNSGRCQVWNLPATPTVSPLAFAAPCFDQNWLGQGPSAMLLASADGFHTQQWIGLPAAAQELANLPVVDCGAGVSAVQTRSRLLLSTPSGIFRVGRDFQNRYYTSLKEQRQEQDAELLLMGCIERVIVGGQASPFQPEFSDTVLAVEGRQGGPVIHLLSSSPASGAFAREEGRFQQLLDKDGLSFSSWAQHIAMLASASPGAVGGSTSARGYDAQGGADDSPLVVVDAAFALIRPTTFLFLVRLRTSWVHCLIAFDAIMQSWSLRYAFSMSSSSSAETSSSSSVPSSTTLRGLNYASAGEAEGALLVWGTELYISFDHGFTFNAVGLHHSHLQQTTMAAQAEQNSTASRTAMLPSLDVGVKAIAVATAAGEVALLFDNDAIAIVRLNLLDTTVSGFDHLSRHKKWLLRVLLAIPSLGNGSSDTTDTTPVVDGLPCGPTVAMWFSHEASSLDGLQHIRQPAPINDSGADCTMRHRVLAHRADWAGVMDGTIALQSKVAASLPSTRKSTECAAAAMAFWRGFRIDTGASSTSSVFPTPDSGRSAQEMTAILRTARVERDDTGGGMSGHESSGDFADYSGQQHDNGVGLLPTTRLFFDWHDTVVLRLRVSHSPCNAARLASSFGFGAELPGAEVKTEGLPGCDAQRRTHLEASSQGDSLVSSWRPLAFQLDPGAKPTITMAISTSLVSPVRSLASEQSGHLVATEYRIELREIGANVSVLSKRAAGQHLDLAALHVKYLTGANDTDRSCLAAALAPEHCEAHGQQSTVLTLYSGCPPGRTLHFDVVASYKDAMGRVLDHGCNQPAPVPSYHHFAYVGQAPLDPETAPCVWVGHDFYPSFSMYDSVTGRSVPYSGTFRLTIVAGGPTHDTIQPCLQRYTAEQQRAFSMWPAVSNAGDHTMDETNSGKEEVGHSAPVFGFLKEADMAMPSRSGMVWICSPGSPCADVRPLWPHTPEYYFTFRLDTLHTEGSYCLYTTTFTIRLHGLPMDFRTTIALVFGTLVACLSLLLFSYLGRLPLVGATPILLR